MMESLESFCFISENIIWRVYYENIIRDYSYLLGERHPIVHL